MACGSGNDVMIYPSRHLSISDHNERYLQFLAYLATLLSRQIVASLPDELALQPLRY